MQKAILKIPLPNTPTDVRSFLGTAGWCRRFIRSFVTISAALTDILKKREKFT